MSTESTYNYSVDLSRLTQNTYNPQQYTYNPKIYFDDAGEFTIQKSNSNSIDFKAIFSPESIEKTDTVDLSEKAVSFISKIGGTQSLTDASFVSAYSKAKPIEYVPPPDIPENDSSESALEYLDTIGSAGLQTVSSDSLLQVDYLYTAYENTEQQTNVSNTFLKNSLFNTYSFFTNSLFGNQETNTASLIDLQV